MNLSSCALLYGSPLRWNSTERPCLAHFFRIPIMSILCSWGIYLFCLYLFRVIRCAFGLMYRSELHSLKAGSRVHTYLALMLSSSSTSCGRSCIWIPLRLYNAMISSLYRSSPRLLTSLTSRPTALPVPGANCGVGIDSAIFG
jgi:hypothetical protein